MIGYTIFTIAVALWLGSVSYTIMAHSRGWPVGEILSGDAPIPPFVGFVTGLWALAKSFYLFNWWSPIVILAAGWILAFAITMLLKQRSQFLWVIGVFPAFLFTILYTSESKPLGILHMVLN